jgi:glycosyltransferase involved in cell wall biosynthesis
MGEERGVLAAVEAMGHVRQSDSDATLLLVGRMPEALESAVRQTMSRLGLGAEVRCVDWVDYRKVGAYLAVSEIGLVPFARTKKFEKNIPQKIFEYWAVGLPVIATDLAPIRYYVDRCGGGILTETNEPELLARTICALLAQPVLAREMGLKGKAMVERAWRWEHMEADLLAAYRELAESVA